MGWRQKYKKSIDCNNPKGFSQKAHCAGRKKRESVMKFCQHTECAESAEHIYEKKDACYHKVKARYDVWPSAYASGALVKCRKVGAANWGNKSKKEGLDDLKALPKDLKKSIKKNREESVNEAGMEMNKLKDAIKMFQKKIDKQGRVTNARDEEHLSNLIKLYVKMGGKGIKEASLGDKFNKRINQYKKKIEKEKEAYRKAREMQARKNKRESVEESYDLWAEDGSFGYTMSGLVEAEYQGRKVKLGKPMRGDVKKFKVYVKNPAGNVVKVNFGQGKKNPGGTMRIRKSNPKARANFRARHNCDNPGPRHKARYWSCRKW